MLKGENLNHCISVQC